MDDLLCLLEPELLQAAALLFEQPLYQAAENGEIHILFASMGASADEQQALDALFRMSMRCQVLDHVLHLHVVSDRAADWKEQLLQDAPALPNFLSIDGNCTCDMPLLHLTFEGWDTLDLRLGQCRYIAADRQTAAMLEGKCRTDARLVPIGLPLDRHADTLRRLGSMAFRQHFFYARQYDVSAAPADALTYFRTHRYEQMANLPSVLHIRYKLWSVGIDPEASADTIAEQYAKVLDDTGRMDRLTLLEHNIWMTGKLLDGYRPPMSAEELAEHCFTGGNNKWRIDDRKVHNCLYFAAPDSRLQDLPHAEWDRFTPASIAASAFDDLDKMSLLVHVLGREKLPVLKAQLNRTVSDLPAFSAWLELAMRGAELGKKDRWLRELRRCGLPADVLQLAETFCSLCVEVFLYKNYRTLDRDIVGLAGELYCKPEGLTIVKLPGAQIVDDIAAALLLEPEKIVFFGKDADAACHLQSFFQNRGAVTRAVFEETADPETFLKVIGRENAAGFCLIDVTGSAAGPALRLAEHIRMLPHVGMIACDSHTQTIENLLGFPMAGCVRRKIGLRVEEVFALFGAQRKGEDGSFDALILGRKIDALWHFFRKYHADLRQICPMMQAAVRQAEGDPNHVDVLCRTGPGELEIREEKVKIGRKLFAAALGDLQADGLIDGLTLTDVGDRTRIAFTFCHEAVRKAFLQRGNFLEYKVWAELTRAEVFDDVQSSFFFEWDAEKITNELDVVGVNGFDLHLFSCKCTKPQKEHLFEVAALAHQFSHNSRACVIYAFDPDTTADWKITFARAEKMGIGVANALQTKSCSRTDNETVRHELMEVTG